MSPGSHCCGYYPGTLSCSYVCGSSMCAWSSNDLQWLDLNERSGGQQPVSFSSLASTVPGFDSSPPGAAHMCWWTGSTLVKIMACRLVGAKPLSEPMVVYCQLDSWEQISMKFELKFYHFHSRKFIWTCCLPQRRPFCPGRDELNKNQKPWYYICQ